MFWRSVVGKLWFTFLLLVSVVLSILMVLLLQSFERFHVHEAESQLVNHANMIATMFEEYDSQQDAFYTIEQYGQAFDTHVIILVEGEKAWSTDEAEAHQVALDTFFTDETLSQVFSGEQVVMTEGDFVFIGNGEEVLSEIMIVGVPLSPNRYQDGAVFLYQSLSAIEAASNETKQIIYFSAGIALVLTTIFAFFLSTRINAPLRKMREVALEVAQGKFDTKVPIVTHDEIGHLAIAFNKMGRELNNNIHALNQEKEQLSRILGSMADGVITINKKGRVVLTNPPAERFIQSWYYEKGLSQGEDEQLPATMKQLFEKVVLLEKEQVTEVEMQGRSWTVLMTPLYDRQEIRGAVAVFRDMTEERRHDKLRKDFIANVSHELRTPISMLQGYSEAIIDDIAGSDEEKKEIAKIIYDESLRMGRLVNELLDIARMEAGHVELNVETVELQPFAERIVWKFHGLAREQKIDLDLDMKDVSRIQCDPDRIEQVLTNLLHNAIRHTSEHGRVKLVIHEYDEGFKFDVIDTGSGIPEEDLPYVFERFYKADKARTRERGGTGLGLAIAKHIVEAHEGTISVHSKINEGTTFSFYLPK
ncbi:sensor histidine kinase ResE [Halalkalibacter wakoensis JCM 9140]|uniref:histidine kinase n=1 Tax=Halalkalibacter wakoensis JCM 9140 TaxID=1236970 RepID=W4Q115_9BACI|nr:ATP-binding protein [Halalkalibacter wakoensis]GAE25672.1 sensor histidine kinase ResE [Halalkalibacter wakoensis JCM 9140]